MVDYAQQQLNQAMQIKNKKSQEEFTKVFGTLSAPAIDFIRSEYYDELIQAIYKFYIEKGYTDLKNLSVFDIDLKDPEKLAALNDAKLKMLGREGFYKELVKLREAIKDFRVI